jgi:hypothetical protein
LLPSLIFRSSNPTGLLFWCVVGFCAGIGLFVYGFRLLQRRRLILDTPFSKIRSASMGMVEISGLAVGPYTMIAPITARPCYYYRTQVWEWKQSGKDKQWVEVAAECMHLPFFVDDNTGRMLVDPRGADLDLHCDFKQEFCDSFFTTNDAAPDNVRGFLARHGVVTNNKIKVEEFCIKPRNALFILGTLGDNPGLEVAPQPVPDNVAISSFSSSSSGFSLSLGSLSFLATSRVKDFDEPSFTERFAIPSNAPQAQPAYLAMEDRPRKAADMTQQQRIAAVLLKAGISNPAAWSAAGAPAGAWMPGVQVIGDPTIGAAEGIGCGSNGDVNSATGNGFDTHPAVVLMKGANHGTFLISWRSQQEVARSLGWKSSFMIWGGPALALLSLYIFLSIQHLL